MWPAVLWMKWTQLTWRRFAEKVHGPSQRDGEGDAGAGCILERLRVITGQSTQPSPWMRTDSMDSLFVPKIVSPCKVAQPISVAKIRFCSLTAFKNAGYGNAYLVVILIHSNLFIRQEK
jgi:hypothetical protein